MTKKCFGSMNRLGSHPDPATTAARYNAYWSDGTQSLACGEILKKGGKILGSLSGGMLRTSLG